MRNFFIGLFLLFCFHVSAQDTVSSSLNDTASMQQAMKQTQQTMDSLAAMERFRRNADQNMQNLINYQKQRNEAQKKKAYLYIGFGLAMLVVLIVGLRRRVKK